MGWIQTIFQRIRTKRPPSAHGAGRFGLEPLEPRLLLSADAVGSRLEPSPLEGGDQVIQVAAEEPSNSGTEGAGGNLLGLGEGEPLAGPGEGVSATDLEERSESAAAREVSAAGWEPASESSAGRRGAMTLDVPALGEADGWDPIRLMQEVARELNAFLRPDPAADGDALLLAVPAGLRPAVEFNVLALDLLVPYAFDSHWQNVIGTFLPLQASIDVIAGRPGSFFGILSGFDTWPDLAVEVEVAASLSPNLEGSTDVPVAVGELDAGVELGIAGKLGYTIPIVDTSDPNFNPILTYFLGEPEARVPAGTMTLANPTPTWAPGLSEGYTAPDVFDQLAGALEKGVIGGVTVITHGFKPYNGEDSAAGWLAGSLTSALDFDGDGAPDEPPGRGVSPGDSLMPLALAMLQRQGGYLLDYDIPSQGAAGWFDPQQSIFLSAEAVAGADQDSVEVIVVFD